MPLTTPQQSFVDQQLLSRLGSLSQQEADQYPFGIVKLDDSGVVQLYNEYCVNNFGGYHKQDAIGKNYFTEVAPCSNNFLFSGRFNRGVQSDNLDFEFDYCFTYKILPTNVKVRLYRDPASKTNWIFVSKAQN